MIYPWQSKRWQEIIERRQSQSHALLLYGQSGTGKRDFAEHFAHAMLCEDPDSGGIACGRCAACGWLAAGTHPDLHLLCPDSETSAEASGTDDAKEDKEKKQNHLITVAQVRELIGSVGLSASRGGMRVILLHPAEAMNVQAANALLKTLEEPPSNTLFILVSHQLQRLLPTIRSRCLKIAMPVPSRRQAHEWLQAQGVAEPEVSLAQAGFAPLRALALSDAGYREKRAAFLASLDEKLDPFALAEMSEKLELAWVLNWLQTWVYDLLCAHATGKVRYHQDFSDKLTAMADAINIPRLLGFQSDLIVAQRSLHHPLNVRLLLEQLLLSFWQSVNRKQEGARVR